MRVELIAASAELWLMAFSATIIRISSSAYQRAILRRIVASVYRPVS